MENRLTDNEIIKALECCIGNTKCGECPMFRTPNCMNKVFGYALDLMNRKYTRIAELEAEVERLKKKYSFLHKRYIDMMQMKIDVSVEELIQAKSEAIKELENRLYSYLGVGHLRPPTEGCFSEIAVKKLIERVVKEMLDL